MDTILQWGRRATGGTAQATGEPPLPSAGNASARSEQPGPQSALPGSVPFDDQLGSAAILMASSNGPMSASLQGPPKRALNPVNTANGSHHLGLPSTPPAGQLSAASSHANQPSAGFFGVLGGSSALARDAKEQSKSARVSTIMRIRVATSAGTLLIPVPSDYNIAWLLAEAHARLFRFQEDKEEGEEAEQRSVFTTARSLQGDMVDVSDLVGDVLTNGETLIGLTEIESRYAPRDVHPLFATIMATASADPAYLEALELRKHRARQSDVFFVNGDDDDAPPPEVLAKDAPLPPIPDQAEGVADLRFQRRSSIRPVSGPTRRLSLITGGVPASVAETRKVKTIAEERKVALAAPGQPSNSIATTLAGNLLEVLTRVAHPSASGESTTAPVFGWVPCVVEVVGEGDDEGFMQVRFVGQDGADAGSARVEVVGVDRLRIMSAVELGGSVLNNGEVEVLVRSEENPADEYVLYPGVAVGYGMGAGGINVTVRLLMNATVGDDDEELCPLISVPVSKCRLPGHPGITPRDQAFLTVAASLLHEEEEDAEAEVDGLVEEPAEIAEEAAVEQAEEETTAEATEAAAAEVVAAEVVNEIVDVVTEAKTDVTEVTEVKTVEQTVVLEEAKAVEE
ncbi:hypothetical protein HK101_011095 [Irineochytrium annulatum]|nr:hypothetical protein HK101_011095 [Irineochytrium annulatum]